MPPRAPRVRSISNACVAFRLGRKPYEHEWKSASKIGSSTSVAAICATRSRTVGIPNGRCRPSAFGMYRRLTAQGRYVPARNRAPRSSRNCSTPACSMSASVIASTPAAPRFAVHSPPCFPQDVTPVDAVHQRMEASARLPLGRTPESALQLAHLVRRTRVLRGDWNRSCRSCPRACLLVRRCPRRDPSLRPRCSSRASSLLRSPRTPVAPRSLSPVAYTAPARRRLAS